MVQWILDHAVDDGADVILAEVDAIVDEGEAAVHGGCWGIQDVGEGVVAATGSESVNVFEAGDS